MASKREPCQEVLEFVLVHVEDGGELLEIFAGSLSLTVKYCRDGNFVTAQFFGNGFKGKLFESFGLEEG